MKNNNSIFKKKSVLYLLVLAFAFLAACVTSPVIPAVTETPIPSVTPLSLTTTPLSPTETHPIPTPTPMLLERAQYTLYATLDYAQKTVEVEESILYPNKSGEALNDLLLAVEPNYWPSGIIFHELVVDGVATNYTLEGQRLSIPLAAPLAPNQNIQLNLRYTLNLPFAEQATS